MTRLENPVLTRELRSRLRIRKLIPAILLRCVCLGLLFLLVLLLYLGRGVLAFILAETLLILLFTPGAVCRSFKLNIRQGELRALSLTRLSTPAILLGKLAVADFHTFVVIAFSGIAMCAASLFRADLGLWRLVCANTALLILGFSSAVTGLAFSMLLRRSSFASYALVYTLIFLLIASVIAPGPLMERMHSSKAKTAIAKLAVYANPLIMTSRALGRIDIMRTRYVYILADPIVSWGFTYPDWYTAGGIYLAISCLLLIPIFAGFRHRIRLPERTIDAPRSQGCF
ncbi:hypothetical protein ACFL6S_12575 [Candidatus Poribacteria bacterium]